MIQAMTLALLLTIATAKDFGQYGEALPIAEIDIAEYLQNKVLQLAETGGLEAFMEEYQNKIKNQIRNPSRITGITKATEDLERTFDPTTILEQEISAENIYYPAGTPINPLDYMPFNESLLFIDGEDEDQVAFAHHYQDKNQNAKIISIAGKIGEQQSSNEDDSNNNHRSKTYFHFFDQGATYSKRFNIVKVPSIVFQKPKQKVLTIREVSLEVKR